MNGIHWVLEYVNPYNPFLIDRTGRLTLGTTDPITKKSIRIKWVKRFYATKSRNARTCSLCSCKL